MTSHPRPTTQTLRQLATLYGVQTAYMDTAGQWRRASADSLLAVLQRLGVPVSSLADTPSALRARQQALCESGIGPVVALWSNQDLSVALRLPNDQIKGQLQCQLTLESGENVNWASTLRNLSVQQSTTIEGVAYSTLRLSLPSNTGVGYHRLYLTTDHSEFETLVMVSPPRAYETPSSSQQRDWGVFAPLYALHSKRSWGSGDFSDLEALATWTARHGGRAVATLPLLAAFLDQPFEPSPYAPASRLFWNELYLDITRAPGWETCPDAQQRLSALGDSSALAMCQSSARVDYRQVMAIKRPTLHLLAQHFFATAWDQNHDFLRFLQEYPEVEDYAQFRAVGDHLGTPWTQWPESLRAGTIQPHDYKENDRKYHVYVQWAAHCQLTQLTQSMQHAGVQLYLDLPLGVHAQSYDVWRERDTFVLDASVGAPPDSFFTKGQDWGFPPLHPSAMRQQGYRYLLAYLRRQFQHTGLLRIDHVMGLHRMYWIPRGADPDQGVYVRYPADELYAILNLESHRHHVTLVGENLGTVPNYVNQAMTRHRLQRMYVAQYELTPEYGLPKVPQHTVASLNTHDMPPFAAFAQGLDIDDREQQGLLTPDEAAHEHQQRQLCLKRLREDLGVPVQPETDNLALTDLLAASLAHLSSSSAKLVLLNLEDLWLETQPQNYPGTHLERPNWQCKLRYSLEQLMQMTDINTLLELVHQARAQRNNRA